MEESFDPVNQLRKMLGPKPSHPWGALIPQVLLWSFRRFCMKKLLEDSDTPITEQLWDDHLQLVHQYAPEGLNVVCESWFQPENIDFVYSSLEEYNRFFIEFLVMIEGVASGACPELENKLASFLDGGMRQVIYAWLEEYNEFIIFPDVGQSDDLYPDERFTALIKAIIVHSSKIPEPTFAQRINSLAPLPRQYIRPMPTYIFTEYKPTITLLETTDEEIDGVEVITAKEALLRRRTRRAERISRGKTRRSHTVA
jgi:hypothetical protein